MACSVAGSGADAAACLFKPNGAAILIRSVGRRAWDGGLELVGSSASARGAHGRATYRCASPRMLAARHDTRGPAARSVCGVGGVDPFCRAAGYVAQALWGPLSALRWLTADLLSRRVKAHVRPARSRARRPNSRAAPRRA